MCLHTYIGTPNLHKNLIVRLQDGDVNIPVDLHQDPAPFPEPDIFNWSKDGQQLSADVNATYSTLTFSTVTKNSTGKYTVTATNFLLDNSSQQLGSDTGCIFLDVLCEYYYYYYDLYPFFTNGDTLYDVF